MILSTERSNQDQISHLVVAADTRIKQFENVLFVLFLNTTMDKKAGYSFLCGLMLVHRGTLGAKMSIKVNFVLLSSKCVSCPYKPTDFLLI